MNRTLLPITSALWFLVPVAARGQIGLEVAQSVGLRGGLIGLIAGIIQGALGLVGVLALAYLVYGGFLYITSRGEEDQIRHAKTTLTYAIFGIVVIGLAYAVVTFVIRAFMGGGAGQGVR